jgi:hypothetical protein
MNIPYNGEKIRLFIAKNGFVAVLEEMTGSRMPPNELPRRKQRGIKKENVYPLRRKRRGIEPTEIH